MSIHGYDVNELLIHVRHWNQTSIDIIQGILPFISNKQNANNKSIMITYFSKLEFTYDGCNS